MADSIWHYVEAERLMRSAKSEEAAEHGTSAALTAQASVHAELAEVALVAETRWRFPEEVTNERELRWLAVLDGS